MKRAAPPLPPARRSAVAGRLTAAAAVGRFELQRCGQCSAVQYPPREACHRCLSVELRWERQAGSGQLIAETTLHHSHEPYFRQRLPWRIGLIRLDGGPTVLAHVHRAVPAAPAPVELTVRLDMSGQAVLIARPPGEEAIMNDDPRIREMGSDPRGLNVFISDGATPVGQALSRDFLSAGAAKVWLGEPPGSQVRLPESPSRDRLLTLPLDVRSDESVQAAAAAAGPGLDIFVNNSRYESDANAEQSVREEMEINYFGLLRLCEHFSPPLHGRPGAAWLNLLAIQALCNLPAQLTFSASMAAALSVSQGMRAQLRANGVRLINVFSGQMTAEALSKSVIAALRNGVEDAYAGELAQEWLARWLESPKTLERQVTG